MKTIRIVFLTLLTLIFLFFAIPFAFDKSTKAKDRFYEAVYNACINNLQGMIPDENQGKEYCTCITSKLTNLDDKTMNRLHDLNPDKPFEFVNKIDSIPDLAGIGLDECVTNIDVSLIEWTSELKSVLKQRFMNEYKDFDSDGTFNLEKYCDCLVQEYSKHSVEYIQTDEFEQGGDLYLIDSLCTTMNSK